MCEIVLARGGVEIDWYSTVQYTLLAVHCLHTKYIVLYLVIGIAIDPTVDSLHPCMHDLAPGNYPLEIPSGCVSRAYLVQFEQSHVLKEQANTSRARAAREQSRTSTGPTFSHADAGNCSI